MQLGKRLRSESPILSEYDLTTVDLVRTYLREEIDLEIALRRRFLESTEARFYWALLLQQNLGINNYDSDSRYDINTFKDAATETFNVTELFYDFLPVQNLTIPSRHSSIERQLPPLPAARVHSSRYPYQDAFKDNRKFLFIRDSTSDPPLIYKLVCPDCQRSDFPNTQGLLNHCRLKHKKEHGSHDECIQACATLVSEDDIAQSVGGIEVTGMSLSLRRLFEIAVGATTGILRNLESDDALSNSLGINNTTESDRGNTTLLSQTLGHHKDTPALAPFLGRSPKRRCIHVHDTDEELDFMSGALHLPSLVKYEMSTVERMSLYEESLESNMEFGIKTEPIDDKIEHLSTDNISFPGNVSSGTRFHIMARVIISDWSRRITQESHKLAGTDNGPTHEWKINVTSPSYSLHVTSILAAITVASITQPASSSLSESIVAESPSFSVSGVSSTPFLARVTLHWVGKHNAPSEVDHWVELDVGKTTKLVLGQEQFFDIELDRNTQLLPSQNEIYDVHQSSPANVKLEVTTHTIGQDKKDENMSSTVLHTLLPRFPLTSKDVKTRGRVNVPYLLVSNATQYNNLVDGRRKAIELCRARAMLNGYREISQSSTSNGLEELAVADVYRWLVEGGHLPRPQKHQLSHDQLQNISQNNKGDRKIASPKIKQFCSFCGMNVTSSVNKPELIHECKMPVWAAERPVLEVRDAALTVRKKEPVGPVANVLSWESVLTCVDSSMTLAIRTILLDIKLSNFFLKEEAEQQVSPLPSRRSRPETGQDLTTAAILAASSFILIKRLIKGGLFSLKSMQSSRQRMLTPSHIFQGLHLSQDEPMLLMFTKLGILAFDKGLS